MEYMVVKCPCHSIAYLDRNFEQVIFNLLILTFLIHKMRSKISIYLGGLSDSLHERICNLLALCLEILNIQYLLIIINTHEIHASSVNTLSNPQTITIVYIHGSLYQLFLNE